MYHPPNAGRPGARIRAITDQIDWATLRTTLSYSLTRRFQIGVEWNPLAESVSRGRHGFSFLLVRGHDPGVSYNVRF